MCPHKQTNIHHQLNQHPQQVNCDVPSSKSVIQLCHCRLSTHVQLSRVTTEKNMPHRTSICPHHATHRTSVHPHIA